jgi:amino acid transporter
MAGRQLYSTGRDGVWSSGLNRAFSAIHPRFKSPWIATLTMGAFTLLWCLAPLRILVIVLAGGTVTVYAGLCLAVLAGRRNGATAHSRFRMPLFPLAPLIALIALLGVAWTSLSDADGRVGFLVSGGVITVSALLYQGVLRRRGGWAHRGPIGDPAAQKP